MDATVISLMDTSLYCETVTLICPHTPSVLYVIGVHSAVASTTRMHFTNISCTGVENAVSDCQTSTSASQCSDSNRHLHVTCRK